MTVSRRDILVAAPCLAAGILAGGLTARAQEPERKVFRLAHLTDAHIHPAAGPQKGLARALEQAQQLGADLVVNGGDAIYDALRADRASVDAQWKAFHEVLRSELSIEICHVVGNHDVLGWGTPGRDEKSKLYTLDQLGLSCGYYSLERGGWTILVLDSVAWDAGRDYGYQARLDEEQWRWLERELGSSQKPCCVISHIPILSACAYFDGPNEEDGDWRVPGQWMHLDARRLKTLFHRHPRVKVCLSGHIHLVDRLEYLGVTYLCNGAVCGNYWKGALQEFEPAFAMLDLHPDGRFEHRMVHYSC